DGLEMPPEGDRLSTVEIARLSEWVRRGLPWPATDRPALERARRLAEDEQIAAARKTFWSFRPIECPPLPAVRAPGRSRTPSDRFVLAKREEHGWAPSPPADGRTLLRRLSFDLVGLPPTPREVDVFLSDDGPDALARLVDRLLASPHYGERWGRH